MCGGGGKPPAAYNPKWQGGADSTLSGNLASQSADANSISGFALPQLQTQVSDLINDPNQASAMSTAYGVAGQGYGVGQGQIGEGQNLYNLASSLGPLAQQIYQTSFDPQSALYQREFQQSTDNQNAIASMYGLSSSPYGAGLASQNANNFNIDWQNNQLGRMATGAGAIQGLDALAGSLGGMGSNLQSAGLNTLTTSGMLPYLTSQGIFSNNLNALGGYAGAAGAAMAPGYSADSALGGYLGIGQSATQLNQQRREYLDQQQAATMGGIGNIVGSLFGNGLGQGFSSLFGGGQVNPGGGTPVSSSFIPDMALGG